MCDAQLGDNDEVSGPTKEGPAQLAGRTDESHLVWGRGLVNWSLCRKAGATDKTASGGEVSSNTPRLTFLPLRHDGVTQRQSSEKLPAQWTLLSPESLHQAGSRHEEAAAGVRVPAEVHGLCTTEKHDADINCR